MKLGRDVTQGHLIPWFDFAPSWRGWQSLGLSPDTIFNTSNVREEFLRKFVNSVICSAGASFLAIVIGSLAAYGLSRFDYKFGPWRNKDISFFFVSQLILPPVVLALPFLVLYKGLALLDTRIGLILIYTLMVLPIVIWVMRDQFDSIPMEMEQAALVDGCTTWGAFLRIVLPDRAAGHGRGLHSVAGPLLERIFLRFAPDRVRRTDFARHGGEPDGLVRHQLVDDRGARDGGDHAASAHRHFPRTLYRHGADRGSGQIAAAPVSDAGPSRDRLRALTMELMLIPGLSGHEGRVRRRLAAEMARLGLVTTTDRLGNLIATAEGDPNRPSVMLFAHMDQLGFVVRKIEASGFLRLERLGGVPERALAAQEVLICVGEGRDIRALIGNKSHHATGPEDKYRVVPYPEILRRRRLRERGEARGGGRRDRHARGLRAETPSRLRETGSREPRSTIAPAARSSSRSRGCLRRFASDRPSISFSRSRKNSICAARCPRRRRCKPDIAIQLDLMLATDTPDMQARGELALGGGPAMSLYSFHGRGTLNGTMPHPALVALFERTARRAGMRLAAQRAGRRAHRLVLRAAGRARRRRDRRRLSLPLHAFLAGSLRSRRSCRPDRAARRCGSRASTATSASIATTILT